MRLYIYYYDKRVANLIGAFFVLSLLAMRDLAELNSFFRYTWRNIFHVIGTYKVNSIWTSTTLLCVRLHPSSCYPTRGP